MGLKYIGSDPNTDWLPGVPARDLTDEEAGWWPEAAMSRLYVEEPKPRRTYTRRAKPPVAAGEE